MGFISDIEEIILWIKRRWAEREQRILDRYQLEYDDFCKNNKKKKKKKKKKRGKKK